MFSRRERTGHHRRAKHSFPPDAIAGFVFLILGVAILVAVPTIEGTRSTDPLGPRFLPKLLSLVLIGLSALLIISALFKARASTGSDAPVETAIALDDEIQADAGARETRSGSSRNVYLLITAMTLYVTFLPTIGYLLGSFLFFSSILAIAGQRRPVVLVCQALGTTIALFLLFDGLLNVNLPEGVLSPATFLR
jgi:hypothetical protein